MVVVPFGERQEVLQRGWGNRSPDCRRESARLLLLNDYL